jgi:hydroxymethylpyrimidine/phosphomethylpyrimidine kinase
MPDLSWWNDSEIESYQDAFRELPLPQTTVLLATTVACGAGRHRNGQANDCAARHCRGRQSVCLMLVTGISCPGPIHRQRAGDAVDRAYSEKFELWFGCFAGAGENAVGRALTALLANGNDLQVAT